MFIAFIALVLIATVPLFGGRLGNLARIQLRGIPLLFGALALQVLITNVIPGANHVVLVGIHLATYGMAGVFIWLNRGLPGLVLIAVGGALNGFVIALNHGTLPAREGALRDAGIVVKPEDFANSGVLAHPRLGFLGDVVATPSWLPFRNVISIGDVIALLGTAVLLHAVCNSRLARIRMRRALLDQPAMSVAASVPPSS